MGVPSDIRAKTNMEEMTMALYENTIQLKGFIGKDAETKSTANGNTFTVFSLATKSSYKDKQSGDWVSHTEWHRIVSFGTAAKYAQQLQKGDYAEVEGELRSSEYDAEIGTGKKSSPASAAVGKCAPASFASRNALEPPRPRPSARTMPRKRLVLPTGRYDMTLFENTICCVGSSAAMPRCLPRMVSAVIPSPSSPFASRPAYGRSRRASGSRVPSGTV